MGDVVDFAAAKEARAPHLSGRARCLACRHEWEAVVPVGTVWLECPAQECGLHRGRIIGWVEIGNDRWVCNCGNDLFHCNSARGMYCPNCGTTQTGHTRSP